MHYIPAFLRSLSQMNTGLVSNVEDRAEEVDSIISSSDCISFKQSDEVPIWRYEEALQGKTLIEHGRKVKVSEEVEQPNRHWWIITEGLLENLELTLRDHADIFDLILAINLCIDEPVAFSQSPGQTVGGAFRVRKGALDYRSDLSPGGFPLALMTMNEIPTQVYVSEGLENIYEMVRFFRSTLIETDEDMDIKLGLHMYDDALTSSLWTMMSNLFFVCENVLCSGRPSKPTERIADVTGMSVKEAENWKSAVNRLKHPDKGNVPGLVQQDDLEVPTLWYIRQTTNTALIHTMRRRFSEVEDN
jgi:hypothetical protein